MNDHGSATPSLTHSFLSSKHVSLNHYKLEWPAEILPGSSFRAVGNNMQWRHFASRIARVMVPSPPKNNIIVFGESGAGKSSILNLIVGQPVAKVSSGFVGCTFKHECYEATIGDTPFFIYDTVGLNQGEKGCVPHWKAIHELYTLIRSLDGVSLLIYCMRGRIKETARANWILFHKVLCAKKVPIIAVETGLEHEGDLEGRRVLLKDALKKYWMVPKNIACIVSVEGRKKEHLERYNWSRAHLRELIIHSYKRKPWSMTTDDWIGHIYKTTYSTKLCFFSDVRLEFAEDVRNVVDEFIKETGMKADESAKLKSTLLAAEKKSRRFLQFLR